MTREKFVEHAFSRKSEDLLTICDQIVTSYQEQGLRLTLRQLFYVLIARVVVQSANRVYKNLSGLISMGRLAGRIDWDAIEDRIRVPQMPPEFANLDELVDAAIASYRLPRWKGQPYYAELWVEKDALAGILLPLAQAYHVTLMVNRGYGSTSSMYDAHNRFAEHADQRCVLFYLGDLDPSGEDMVRDIRDRFEMFGIDVDVRKIALTIEQVRQYNLPPNPAKRTDPRAREFIRRYGESSWEVDALPPEVLDRLIRDAFDVIVDRHAMQEVIEQEERDKESLRRAVKRLRRRRDGSS